MIVISSKPRALLQIVLSMYALSALRKSLVNVGMKLSQQCIDLFSYMYMYMSLLSRSFQIVDHVRHLPKTATSFALQCILLTVCVLKLRMSLCKIYNIFIRLPYTFTLTSIQFKVNCIALHTRWRCRRQKTRRVKK